MSYLHTIYASPLGLLTDLYQLTMAYGYWKLGRAKRHAVFHLFFRKPPFEGGYAIAAGLDLAVELVQLFRFSDDDCEYLRTLTGNDEARLFSDDFLTALRQLEFSCDIDAMPEGTLCFGQEPLLRIRGPLLECQLLETALLNVINFQTLIATKAARIVSAAGNEPVLEFGLRRAQGIDGGLAASRAAYVGGCAATSNVLAGKLFGIPVKGTHAHSWVMSFETELEAFDAYAEAMPNNCVFLVDTYDTIQGVQHAIDIGRQLSQRGHRMVGIRLDSGDLASLSIKARELLDDAGFQDTTIVASNDLDEHIIDSLHHQGAKVGIWGVGTKLATAYDQPALGGVYKLGAVEDEQGQMQPRMKRSEQPIKTSIPGELQVRRYRQHGQFLLDMIYDVQRGIDPRHEWVDRTDPDRIVKLTADVESEDLLVPVVRQGTAIREAESLEVIRQRVKQQLEHAPPGVTRFLNAHQYRVGLDVGLHEFRRDLLQQQMRAEQ